MSSLGKILRKIRKEKSLLQSEIAVKTGLSQAAYSQIEADLYKPTDGNFLAICTALGLSDKEIQAVQIEADMWDLGMTDPDFILMLKDIPMMTPEEKQSIIDVYELIVFKRQKKLKDQENELNNQRDSQKN